AHITKVSCTDPSGTRRYEAAVDGDGLNGYVYGDDNMLGISGVKEDLSGEHIGKAILASFAEGVANAFSKVPSMVGITGEVTDTGASTFTDGFASGSSQSLEFIAKYYLEQAKSFLPVISIKAGRKVAIGFAADMEFKSVEFKTVFVNTPYEYKPSDTLMDDTKKPKLSLN
ncbi:MAG: TrbI/VirB10 family protein, partial [Campylobacterales bacterium]|nr:TrbI/VirB10 family protein [Campylobacterales bacterium]